MPKCVEAKKDHWGVYYLHKEEGPQLELGGGSKEPVIASIQTPLHPSAKDAKG